MAPSFEHTTVLLNELIEAMNIREGSCVIDCTAGGGGHLGLALKAVGKMGRVLAIDQDRDAINFLRTKFSAEIEAKNLFLHHGNFSDLSEAQASYPEIHSVAGIFADLGVSSYQLDQADRGFSLRFDAPLDMRMNQNDSFVPAYDLVNGLSLEELRTIISDYGEDPKAHQIAKAIIRKRETAPIKTTLEVAKIVAEAIHYDTPSKIHPATRTFQALRIAVNREIEVLEKFLKIATDLIAPGGRMGFISFHSLEDRLIKHQFQTLAGKRGKDPILRHLPVTEEFNAEFLIVKPFPIIPSDEEIRTNSRSRSAKLRVIERLSSH